MIRKATRMGLEGDLQAMRLVLDRTCGRVTEAPAFSEPLGIELPRFGTASECSAAIQKVIEAICNGEVDRDLAKLLIDAVHARLRTIEVTELQDEVMELKESMKREGSW